MPKVTISETNFEEMDIYTQKYNVRYRIITDNQNNLSSWSPIFEVDPEFVFQGGTIESPGIITLNEIGSTHVMIVWDSASVYKEVETELESISQLKSYDIWIKWAGASGANPSDWIYRERVSSTSLNINIPANYIDATGTTRSSIDYLYVEVYRPGRPTIRYEKVYDFLQSATTVNTSNDSIDFGVGHGYNTGSEQLYLSATPIGGLSDSSTYYIRVIDYTTVALYTTNQDALDDTSRVNLSSTGSGTGSFTGFPFRLYDSVITTL